MGEFNIKSTTLEKSIDLIKDFLEKVIGPPLDELGLMFSDNIKMRRLKNQVRNLEKVKKIAEAENISIQQINLKALVPYLEGVSLEEEETLQDMWANLFLNYIDTSKNLTLTVYPSILKQLSTHEVEILNFMIGNENKINTGTWSKTKDIEFSNEEIANLNRLGIIEEVPQFSQYGGDYDSFNGQYKWQTEQVEPEEYFITTFGIDFIYACRR